MGLSLEDYIIRRAQQFDKNNFRKEENISDLCDLKEKRRALGRQK